MLNESSCLLRCQVFMFQMMSLSMGMADNDISAPGLNLSQAWCEAMEQDTVCMCSPGWELVPINISAIAPSNPELHIMMDNLDWWLEGVCLPIIALIGVCGEREFYFSEELIHILRYIALKQGQKLGIE